MFSPATKAEEGHDENITFAEMVRIVGADAAERLRGRASRSTRGRDIAAERGVIIADTKFEFGRDEGGEIRVMDEVLTPDSSRFWPAAEYAEGRAQPSFDKQPLRDYLETLAATGAWDKQPPAPELPVHLIAETAARYQAIFRTLTGMTLDEFPLSEGGTA